MFEDPTLNRLSHFLDLSVARSKQVLSNMANIDTPGYRTRDLDFRTELARADGALDETQSPPAAREVRGLLSRPDGNNVSLERESLLLADTQLRFNIGVQLLRDRFRQLTSAVREGSTQ